MRTFWSQGRGRVGYRSRVTAWWTVLILESRTREEYPPHPPQSLHARPFRRHPCRRLPSGRHRTRKLDGASAAEAPLARSASTEKTSKPRSTDEERLGCLPEGSPPAGMPAEGLARTLRGGAGGTPPAPAFRERGPGSKGAAHETALQPRSAAATKVRCNHREAPNGRNAWMDRPRHDKRFGA